MLSESNRRAFDESGFLVLPGVFQVDELAWLGEEARAIGLRLSARSRPPALQWSSDEASSGTLIDVHEHEEPFRRLAGHPRLRALSRDLGPEPSRLYRTRLCLGSRSGQGDPIWRRDFEVWRRVLGLRAPRAVTAAVVLDGYFTPAPALRVVPGSHRDFDHAPVHAPRSAATDRPDGFEDRTPVSLMAAFGSVVLLHCATSYALSWPGRAAARLLFLVSYNPSGDTGVEHEAGDATQDLRRPEQPEQIDGSMWPLPIWIAG